MNYLRGYRNTRAKRCSGGLGIFTRNEIISGVGTYKNHEDIIAWIELKKDFFGLQKDIYIANIYIVPEGSVHLKHDPFIALHNDISSLPEDCAILCCGDYNARTNTLPDFTDPVHGSDGLLADLLPHNIKTSFQIFTAYGGIPPHRISQDKVRPNSHCISLLELCKSCGILILNGRTGIDKENGEFTRVDTTGNSVVDYAIASPVLVKPIKSFSVYSKLPESDHRPILFSISATKRNLKCFTNKQTSDGWTDYYQYRWSHSDLCNIKSVLQDIQSEQCKKTCSGYSSEPVGNQFCSSWIEPVSVTGTRPCLFSQIVLFATTQTWTPLVWQGAAWHEVSSGQSRGASRANWR